MKLPDCETPRVIAQLTPPATGLGVPASSCLGVPEERADVAERGEADAQHRRVLRGEHDLVEQVRIEAVLQADLRRIGRAGERMRRRRTWRTPSRSGAISAVAPISPSIVSDAWVVRLACLGVEARRLVRQRVGVDDHRLRSLARRVDDARHDPAGDRRAVGILRDRHDDIIVVRARAPCGRNCRPASRWTARCRRSRARPARW